MSEQKFTKGPWFHDVDGFGICRVRAFGFATYDGTEILAQIRTTSGISFGEADANAHLIAAAPEMYEALKMAVGYLEGMLEDGCPRCGGDCASANPPIQYCPMKIMHTDLAKAKAALAKAEGKT